MYQVRPLLREPAKGEFAMYVCLCAGVSDSKIKSMVRDGSARNLGDVMKNSRAGVTCGACVCQLKEILQQHSDESQQPPAGLPPSS